MNSQSDITRQQLAAITPAIAPVALSPSELPPTLLALKELLASEIDKDYIQIDNFTTHTALTLKDKEMFSSGSAVINPAFLPILDKVAKALEFIPGKIVVTGHTDNQAIRTAQYPSNWHLSLARASAVVKHLDEAGSLESRLIPEGNGSDSPVTSNDTPEGRASNRRVVIDIYYQNSTLEN